jgi:hypothetical protein
MPVLSPRRSWNGTPHCDVFALALQGTAAGENLVGQVFGRVGQRQPLRRSDAPWDWGNSSGVAPHQHAAVFVGRHALGIDEFVLEGLDQAVVDL